MNLRGRSPGRKGLRKGPITASQSRISAKRLRVNKKKSGFWGLYSKKCRQRGGHGFDPRMVEERLVRTEKKKKRWESRRTSQELRSRGLTSARRGKTKGACRGGGTSGHR